MPFLLRPSPQAGESLSSWRQRSGRANAFLWFPTEKTPKLRDPDLEPSPTELNWLSDEFTLPKAKIRLLCLNQFEHWSIGETVGAQFVRWTLNHKGVSDGSLATSGYCPACLLADETPYFRLAWRLAFLTHCPIHHCRLETACPTCGRSCWPATYASRHRYAALWRSLRHCPDCGHDLCEVSIRTDGKHQLSDSLFELLNNNEAAVISDFHQDYFRALWSTCRLIGRKISRFAETEAESHEGLCQVLPFHKKGLVIEKQRASVRLAILSKAVWMLDDWPERFVATCENVHLSRTDFGGAGNCSPPWFDEVVKLRLAKTVNWITREDVATAVTKLETDNLRVSKNALRRQLGVAESWAINEILDQRRAGTTQELANLCQHYRHLIEHTPQSRDQQRTLGRDFLILLCSAVLSQRVNAVCQMSVKEMKQLFQRTSSETAERRDLAIIYGTFSELSEQYALGIRPVFLTRALEDIDYWFLSRFGKKMDGHSVRARFAHIMNGLFEPNLWNSMDVFVHTLSDPWDNALVEPEEQIALRDHRETH